jgi:hypothetical protein
VNRAPWLAAALLAAVAASAAEPPPAPPSQAPAQPFQANYIGEGGGAKASDPATDDYMVGDQKPGPGGASSSDQAAADAPADGAAARPAPARAAASEPDEAAPPAGARSLWNGLVQPLDAAADADDADEARAGSDRDYEARILGIKSARPRPGLSAASRRARASRASDAAALSTARSGAGKVFVAVEINPGEAASLRDAVAALGPAAGFTADPRFDAMPGPGGNVMFSGWMPSSRLADALAQPGVKSLRVETRARSSTANGARAQFLIGLRLDDPARAREGVGADVRALSAATGFRLTKVMGIETAPDGRAVAVVSGLLPLSRLPEAMGLPMVAKISPVGGDVPEPAPAPSASPALAAGGGAARFAAFAISRSPLLIVLTLLLLLPSLREPAFRAAEVFSPYR